MSDVKGASTIVIAVVVVAAISLLVAWIVPQLFQAQQKTAATVSPTTTVVNPLAVNPTGKAPPLPEMPP